MLFEAYSNIRWEFWGPKLKSFLLPPRSRTAGALVLSSENNNSSLSVGTINSNFSCSRRAQKHRCFKYNCIFGPSKHFPQLSPKKSIPPPQMNLDLISNLATLRQSCLMAPGQLGALLLFPAFLSHSLLHSGTF